MQTGNASQTSASGSMYKSSHVLYDNDFAILELLLRNYLADEDISNVRKAYQFAVKAHKGQVRSSGEPYISHPIAVAEILGEFQLDANTIAAGLLHDVLEDSNCTYQELAQHFGESVADIVQGVTKVSQIGSVYRNEETIENLRRMLMATAKDMHVMIIKLADRLHNMRTLHFLPREKQVRIAKDTLEIYAPLAHRLGLGRFKWELEDLCLLFLHPEVYREIKKKVALKRKEREQYIEQICSVLQNALQSKNLKVDVEGRAKHFYSIYNKLLRDRKTFEEIYDLIAVRVLCDTIADCYAVLGEVHTMWRQIEGRFKDYISNPKPNNYRSIHTTVLGPFGRLIEIQIRTHEMHQVAEHGIAAHWRYKEDGKRKLSKDAAWLEAFEQELPDTHDPEDFLNSIRSDLFSEEVYVYTPKGELMRLPQDATPIDYAYKIHTKLGHRCGGAKVNGRMVPLSHKLKTGDVVEIISNPNSGPSPAWLDLVKTASARNKIRRYLLESRWDELLSAGQNNLTRELQKAGFNPLEFYNSEQAKDIAYSLRQKNLNDLFVNIGFGRISTKQVIARLLQPKNKQAGKPSRQEDETQEQLEKRSVVRLGDIDDILYRRALCCNPLPGDDIIGFVTRGRGVTIHKNSCPNIRSCKHSERLMPMFWEEDQQSVIASIEIRADDRKNLLSDLSHNISSTGTNIMSCSSKTIEGMATFYFDVEVTSIEHLNSIMQRLLGIEGVSVVKRIRTRSERSTPSRQRKNSSNNGAYSRNSNS